MTANYPSPFLPDARVFDGGALNTLLSNPMASTEDNITARAGGGFSAAYRLGASISRITTVTTAADSVALPVAVPGKSFTVINAGAKVAQVYATGGATIGGVAGATGVSLAAGTGNTYTCTAKNVWVTSSYFNSVVYNSASRSVVFAAIGDSQILNGNTTGVNRNNSPVNMAAQYTGCKIYFPPENNKSAGGTRTTEIYATLPAALALSPDFLVFDGGTNNYGNTTTDVCIAALYGIVRDTLAAGVVPIYCPITPRTFSFVTAMGQYFETINRAMRELAYGSPSALALAGLSSSRNFYMLDEGAWYDYTSTVGASNPGYIGNDGLHWAYGSGIVFGAQIADIVNSLRPGTPGFQVTTPYDIYDATLCKQGSLLVVGGVNRGMMQGTTGTLTANANPTLLTPTGVCATNWELVRLNGLSTATMVGSKENPRTDGYISGERQRIQIACTTNGSAQEQFQFNYRNGISGINTGFSVGDKVVFEVAYKIASAVSLLGIAANLKEVGPASPQNYIDGDLYSNFLAGNSSAAFPALLRAGVLRTPAMTIQAGTTNLYPQLTMNMFATNAGSTNATLDVMFSDAKVFKVA